MRERGSANTWPTKQVCDTVLVVAAATPLAVALGLG
jgi:hypothetical protein